MNLYTLTLDRANKWKFNCNCLRICFLSIFLVITLHAQPQSGAIDMSFNPSDLGFGAGVGADNVVQSTAVQADGKILMGGLFRSINGTSRNGIARLNADGSLDASFNTGTGFDNSVKPIAVQSDGKILIGGGFTSFNGTTRNSIVRLNADGSLDNSFNPGTGADNYIHSIAIQSDGKLLIGGDFTSFNGTLINRIARLNADGSLDNSFNPGTGSDLAILSVVIQSDGKILIGGEFTSFNGTTLNRIARLNANGSLDNGFNSGTGANGYVTSIAVQSDGKILIGGDFTSFDDIARDRIARLNVDGSLNNEFDPGSGVDYVVESIAVQPDGKVVIGGAFENFNATPFNRIARLNDDGSLDGTFTPGTGSNGWIHSIKVLPSGKLLIGGDFTSFNGSGQTRIALLNSNGTVDAGFNPGMGANGQIQSLAVQSDGKVLIGGEFTSINGTYRNYIARLNTDGSLDPTFIPGLGPSYWVKVIALQSDGKIIIGGEFYSYNGTSRSRIARLNADGSLDDSFNPGLGADNTVYAIALQTDGKVLIGGAFTSIDGTTRAYIARLNANGSLDNSFNVGSGLSGYCHSIAVQSDGKVLIAGGFTNYNGTIRRRIGRLNTDGSLDGTFNPGTGANNSIQSMAIQSDGKILIGGAFSSYNSTSRDKIARLNTDGSLDAAFNPGTGANSPVLSVVPQFDGKILIGGSFSFYNGTSRKGITRLNADGSLDDTFDPGTGMDGVLIAGSDNFISSIAVQSDRKVLIGGMFTSYNGTGRNGVARIINSEFTWSGSTSTDWNTASNWTPAQVPSSGANILIPSGTGNAPVLQGSVSLFSLNVQSGNSLTLGSHTLTLTGSLTNNGTINATTGKLSMAGSAAQNISGLGLIFNLEINNTAGVTIASGTGNMQTLAGTLIPTAGILNTNNNLTIKSDATSTARVGIGSASGGYVTGKVTVERYLPSGRKWRMLTAPLKGISNNSIFYNWQNNDAVVAGTGVEIWGPGGYANPGTDINNPGLSIGPNASMRRYSNGWSDVVNTHTTLLFDNTTNFGYALFATGPYKNGTSVISPSQAAESTTLSAIGTLITGDHTKFLYATSPGQFLLVGNPYASSVDPRSFTTTPTVNRTNLNRQLWMWDAKPGSGTGNGSGLGRYVSFDLSSNLYSVLGNGYPDHNVMIQSGQAFFVQATTSGAATLVFRESSKAATQSHGMMGDGAMDEQKSILRLTLQHFDTSNTENLDGAVAVFHAAGRKGLDELDGQKLTNTSENLMLRREGRSLSFEHRPAPTSSDTLQLRISNMQPRAYLLQATASGFAQQGLTAQIIDRHTGRRWPVDLGGITQFGFDVTADSTSKGDRFEVVFGAGPGSLGMLTEDVPGKTALRLFPNPVTDRLQVNYTMDAPGRMMLQVFDALGAEVMRSMVKDPSAGTLELNTGILNSGVYRVVLTNGSGARITQSFIRQ